MLASNDGKQRNDLDFKLVKPHQQHDACNKTLMQEGEEEDCYLVTRLKDKEIMNKIH